LSAEDVPPEGVVEIGSEGSVERMAPGVHGDMVGHLRPVHATDGADKLMRHRADGCEVVLHGEVDIARSYEAALPVSRGSADSRGKP
jgi:hypothetical protein